MLFNTGDQLVDVYAMCAGTTGCDRPYQVFEKGSAVAQNGTEIPATASEPQFAAADGFMLQRGNPLDGVVSLSDLNILQATAIFRAVRVSSASSASVVACK